VAAPKAERHLLSLNVGGYPWRDCRGSIKQANAGVWEQISIFCPSSTAEWFLPIVSACLLDCADPGEVEGVL
jgi:hypothetical protein